jgi:transcription elongation factor Elf1
MVRIEATFLILEEEGPGATLECPRCGYEFEVNSYTGENLCIDPERKRQLAVCPLCGTVEKADRVTHYPRQDSNLQPTD